MEADEKLSFAKKIFSECPCRQWSQKCEAGRWLRQSATAGQRAVGKQRQDTREQEKTMMVDDEVFFLKWRE
jgi:hypothetical protein